MAGDRMNGSGLIVPGQKPSVRFENRIGPFAGAAVAMVGSELGVEVVVQDCHAIQAHAAACAAAMASDWTHSPQEIAARAVAIAEEVISQAAQRLAQLHKQAEGGANGG